MQGQNPRIHNRDLILILETTCTTKNLDISVTRRFLLVGLLGGSFALIHTHEMDITKWNKRRGDLYKYGLCLNVLFAFFQVLKMGFLRICEKHKKGHRGDKMKMLNSIWRAQSKPEETLRCSVVFRSSFRISELQIANTSFFLTYKTFEKNFSASDPHFQRKAFASVY